MVKIDAPSSLESFRRFTIASTCSSFIPESYRDDEEVFAEREDALGSIYVEAADKVTLKKVRDITFVNAKDVLGIIYNSTVLVLVVLVLPILLQLLVLQLIPPFYMIQLAQKFCLLYS